MEEEEDVARRQELHAGEMWEIDQEPDCPDCKYRCYGFVAGESCSSACKVCGQIHSGECSD